MAGIVRTTVPSIHPTKKQRYLQRLSKRFTVRLDI